ncbi:MAG: NAD(P)/FAD-dependent oxidoreductase [Tabrizicola sp.]|uniref:phytoene desaturase family protein n=1 Tax=Tabrizicola sp. TaxID=2005166 RepID=UPI002734B729|nr:NAD(P)/FAD-dependent oxidoreductase [Tabrizicola sp.]MDP3264694.1 NAD(P)/FAD-dependent oxidoreductase [Tabrizicola sp.]MDP3649889.1 NAD(P)/FAD-dependent oxidoreductase [Paracoccaceae bacterium]MDZ4067849.1 NAD(P)/FAD-dependent oxidoreductase [Tabrizicola sp.]
MTDTFDAILIGAGHNALACGLHLAAKGWRVGIFEQAAEPGGAIKTGEYTLPGFRHDWAAMNLSLFAGSPFFKVYGPELVRHGLAFAPVLNPFASAFPDGRWLGVSTDLAATTARIAAFSTRDAETWKALVSAFPGEAEAIFGLLGSPMNLRALAYFMFKTLRKRGVAGTLDLARFLTLSPRQWLTQTFEAEPLQALLGAWGMHLDFAPDIAGGGLFPYLEGMAGQAFGMVLGQGGADTVTRALTAALAARGATITCNARVTEILHRDGKAHGIRLAGGREITATRAVIAGTAPGALTALTGPTAPAFDRAMNSFTHAPGTLMIHLAMDSLPDWAAGDDLKQFAYVHLAASLDQMARTYAQAQAGLLPDEPILVVGQPTAIDPTRAPDGKHVLWLQVRMAPGTIKGDAGGTITTTDWAQATEPFADRALAILERHAPGTRAKILGKRIVTPLDLEADNPNLVGGDQVCGSHHLAQNFLFRPARGHADGSTPLRNLHLTGAAVWPGAGTGAGSGFLLARRLAGN